MLNCEKGNSFDPTNDLTLTFTQNITYPLSLDAADYICTFNTS